jgi:hypothetical protein
MKRRDFIAVLGGAAAWPLSARAQQGDRVRRIGVLMSIDENDPIGKRIHSAFAQVLGDLGWTDGRNLRIDLRWGRGDINRIRALARRGRLKTGNAGDEQMFSGSHAGSPPAIRPLQPLVPRLSAAVRIYVKCSAARVAVHLAAGDNSG